MRQTPDAELSLARFEMQNSRSVALRVARSLAQSQDFADKFKAKRSAKNLPSTDKSEGFEPVPLDEIVLEADETFSRGGREFHLQARCINPEKLSSQPTRFGVMCDQEEFSSENEGNERNKQAPDMFQVMMSDGTEKTYPQALTLKESERLRESLDYPLFVLSMTYTKAEKSRVNREYVEEMSRAFDGRPFRDLNNQLYVKPELVGKKHKISHSATNSSEMQVKYRAIDEGGGGGGGGGPRLPPGVTFENFRALTLVGLRLHYLHDWTFLDGQEEVEIYVGEHGMPIPLHATSRFFVNHGQHQNWSPPMGWAEIGYLWRESVNPSAAPLKVFALEDDEEAYVSRIGAPTLWGFINNFTGNFAVQFGLPFPYVFTGVSVNGVGLTQDILNAIIARYGSNTTVGMWESSLHYDFRTRTRGGGVEAVVLRGPGFFHSDEFYRDGAIGITERTMIEAQTRGGGIASTASGSEIDFSFRLAW